MPGPTLAQLEQSVADMAQDFERRLDRVEADIAMIKERLAKRARPDQSAAGTPRPNPSRIDPQVVAERLNLTPTESRVAVLLAEGRSVQEAAAAMGRKAGTIRWFLRQINRKLGIHRQTQLVRMVLLLPREARPRTARLLNPRHSGETLMRTLLAALLACLMLTATTVAQESPASAQALVDAGRFEEAIVALRPLLGQEPVDPGVLFLYGVASLEAAQRPGRTAADRGILLNEAIAAFRVMLVNRPNLVRVRLELARAFFLQGRDGLARRHFEAVLAGGVPQEVAANIYTFLNIMQARKRWSGYFGAAIAPDSNLNAASESEIIYIDVFGTRLPFQREGDFGARSGLGLSVWGGGEFRQRQAGAPGPLWLRLGGDTVLREYPGGDFDQFFLAAHGGPLWRLGPRTEVSLLATAQRQWLGSHPYADEFGARLELDRRLTPGIWARGTAAYRGRDHLARDFLDGPVADFTAAFAWTPAPVLRVQMTVGYTRDHAALEHWRSLSRWVRVDTSLALPLGFTLGGGIQALRTRYDGSGAPHLTLDRKPRFDRTRTFTLTVLNRALTLYGFSPQLALIHETRLTNAQAQDFERNRAELRFVRQF